MSTPVETNAAQAANRGFGRGRARGGGRGGTPRTTSQKIPAKQENSKIGPNRLLEVDWVKDNLLKEEVFVVWVGSGKAGDQQWTFHHPIGETALHGSQWVATPTRDICYLLQRRESEALASWKRKAELAKRQHVLHARRGRMYDGQTEVWTFDGAPPIQATIRTCMSAAKAANKPESAWIDYADQSVRVAEQTFKEALKNQGIPEDWMAENARPQFETCGGALGDQPQRAVPYLNGLSTSAAKDKVLRVVTGVDSADALPVPIGTEKETDNGSQGGASVVLNPLSKDKGKKPVKPVLDWADETSESVNSDLKMFSRNKGRENTSPTKRG